MKPLNLEDLQPQETSFELSTMPGQKFTLCRWSLRVRAWAFSKWKAAELDSILREQKVVQIAELAYFMLKDKTKFPALDDFLDAIVSPRDHLALITAFLGTIGLGEPAIEELRKEMHPAPKAEPKPKRKR